ncbi:MAG TPA: SDR family oxidoreductase [Ktedonobacteraceae bacterium]|jgi:NAD(P)-dependent dehydrogenase (short-subunit alcohol dehydrogenase family)
MQPMPAHTPQVVVITGASAGVGRAIVQAFAKRGAHIGLLARGQAGLEAAARDVEALGGKALLLPTDVANAEQVELAAARVEEVFGPIEIWINAAMTSVFSPTMEMTSEDYKRVTEVTYLGFVYGTLAALRRMVSRDRGRIIQIGSALAYRGIPLQSAYCGSKHAIQGFTESVRCELIHDNSHVKISMVQLPAVNTPQFLWVKNRLPNKPQPVPPIYQPEVIADTVTYIADHYRRQLYVGMSTVIAIQANKFFPGLGDWYLGKTGYKSQQTDEPANPFARNNLWAPVDDERDYGAHGTFDNRAHSKSLQVWADTHLSLVGLLLASLVSIITVGLIRKNK